MDTTRQLFDFPLVVPTAFARPLMLFLLAIPVMLLVWVWANRWLMPSRRVVLPVDRARGGSGWWAWTLITLAECLPPLILAVIVVILAIPQRNGPPQQKRSMTNIQFAVDISGSMSAPFGEGDRYDGAMNAIHKFVDHRKGDSFGLTFFGDAFVHWVPLTSDASAIKCATPFMKPDLTPPAFWGTAIAKVLRGVKPVLAQREDGDKMVILVTDGESYDLREAEADLIRDFQAANITVFCIIAASFDPQPEIVNICRNTGGEAFRADDESALPAVFKKIDEMKQAKLTSSFVETLDFFEPFALLAVALIVLWLLTLFGLRYTPW